MMSQSNNDKLILYYSKHRIMQGERLEIKDVAIV
jgi:hypothetical protein